MELLIQAGALVLLLLIVLVSQFRYVPNGLSDFELERRREEGDPQAVFEAQRRPVLTALAGMQAFKIGLLVAGLASLLIITHEWWIGALLFVAYWLVGQVVIAKGWLDDAALALQHKIEAHQVPLAAALAPVFTHMAPAVGQAVVPVVSSKDDLHDMISRDTKVLTPGQKAALQGAMSFNDGKVSDIMVPREQVVVVGVGETVGPLLLDRLHKTGHKIYVVVKKDLDHIQGLLYVGDIAEPHPDLKTVKDAVRPTVHYIAANAPLAGILSASLQSGRQLFIVVDENGNTQGLVTLQDAITKLLGMAPPDHFYTSTDPKKVKQS